MPARSRSAGSALQLPRRPHRPHRRSPAQAPDALEVVDGRRFQGFYTSANAPVLADLGLARTLDDQRAVIQHELPNTADHNEILCGGHSVGGLQISMFAAWDLDGDAGQNLCGAG